jgi:RNA polymerase sigma-70 factor, ECF subfamily
MPNRDDKERIALAVRGFQLGESREQCFRILFDHYYQVVQSFFARRVASPEDRLDLTQETFLRVYKGLKGFRREADFGTWLFRIAFNTHLKWRDRARTQESAPPTVDATETSWEGDELISVAPQPTPLDDSLRHERRRRLHDAIEELPGQMRRCTRLRIYQDLSYQEIAAAMRLSIETVKVHLFQARKKLKADLRDAPDDVGFDHNGGRA